MSRRFPSTHSPRSVRAVSHAILAAIALPLALSSPSWAGSVSVRLDDERAAIENGFLSLEISTASRRLRTASVANRITGASTAFEGEDFVLVFAGGPTVRAREFVVERSVEEPAPGGGKRLVFDLSRDDLHVRLLIELRPSEWWATRWLEIRGERRRLETMSFSEWRVLGTWGPPGPGKTIEGLGYPQGFGQAAYVDDLFFAIEHPGAENFARGKRIACRIPALHELESGKTVSSRRFVVGVGDTGGAVQAFLRFIEERRAHPPRMSFLVGGGVRKGASLDAEALGLLAEVKAASGVPIDAVSIEEGLLDAASLEKTLRDTVGLAKGLSEDGRLGETARKAGIGISLRYRATGADRLCLAGSGSPNGVVDALSALASRELFSIELDGIHPDCAVEGHGHPVGAGAAIAQMDALAAAAAAMRKARPGLIVAHLGGSNPSPFWLAHVDFVSPGGAEEGDAAATAATGGATGGAMGPVGDGLEGEPLDRHATSIDRRLHVHRPTEMPISAFAVTDLIGAHAAASSDAAFERNAWWLVARTSLRHAWRVEPADLPAERWKVLARAARWGKAHERLFGQSRMVGGDAGQGAIYGFAAMDGAAGVLSLRNPSPAPATIERPLYSLLALSRLAAKGSYRLAGVHGETEALEGVHEGRARLLVELPPLAVAIFEVTESVADGEE